MFDFIASLWHAIWSLMWVTGYLVPTWLCAYALKVTAPQSCATGKEYQECYEQHFAHVSRNNSKYAAFLGLLWPMWLLVGGVQLFSKSIDKAAELTPMPQFKPINLDKAITSGEKTTDEMLEMLDELEKKGPVKEVHEGKIIDPRYSD